MQYVFTCPAEQFLDFLEDIFTAEIFWRFGVSGHSNQLVDELNGLLNVDTLPYYLTPHITETIWEGNSRSIRTVAYPKVIMRENDVLHDSAIKPALKLLENPRFMSANGEFLAALEDYRKGDFQDCLTKCGSAFESVLKVICDRKGWPYKQTDTAKALVNTILPRIGLESYFEHSLLIVATLRNKLSSAHGAGITVRQPNRHLTQYALNATGSAILLVAQESGEPG